MTVLCELALLIWKNLLLQIRKPLESIFSILVIIFVGLLLCQIYAGNDRSKYRATTNDVIIISRPKMEEYAILYLLEANLQLTFC